MLIKRKEACHNLSIRRKPDSIALSAKRLRHGGYNSYFSIAIFKLVLSCRVSIAVYDLNYFRDAVYSFENLSLCYNQIFSPCAAAIKRHKLYESDFVWLRKR